MRTFTSSACIGLISPRDFVDVIYSVDNDKFMATCGKGHIYIEYTESRGMTTAFENRSVLINSNPINTNTIGRMRRDSKPHYI